jgi:hypothetical protein
VELKNDATTLARGRSTSLDLPEIPRVTLADVQDAVCRSSYDESRHPLPTCFVCGPARVDGDGLRIIPRALPPRPGDRPGTVVARWVPWPDLARNDQAVAREFVWAALDCPTGFAAVGAQHLGMTGSETVLLGRMRARIARRPHPGDRCIIVAWPTARDGRKLFANSAVLNTDGEPLAFAEATWLVVDRKVQLGE